MESDNWYINVEKCYLPEKEKYISTEGYVLFHEDVNSKALIDMQNNEYMPLGDHDWFTIGDEDLENTDKNDSNEKTDLDDSEDESADSGYSVTVKVSLDTEEAERMICDMRKNFQREFYDVLDMLYIPYLYEYRPRIRLFW